MLFLPKTAFKRHDWFEFSQNSNTLQTDKISDQKGMNMI